MPLIMLEIEDSDEAKDPSESALLLPATAALPPEFPLIGVFLIIGVGHPWLPRPSAGLLDPTYRCTCTCYHQRGPQALESTQGGRSLTVLGPPGGSSRP